MLNTSLVELHGVRRSVTPQWKVYCFKKSYDTKNLLRVPEFVVLLEKETPPCPSILGHLVRWFDA